MKYLNILTAVTLTACAAQGGVVQYPTHTLIHEHLGGVVWQEAYSIAQYKKPIKIIGTCASSCTLAFGYDSCVYPNARVMFHAPRNVDGTINYGVYNMMLNEYPPRIKNWFGETLSGRDYWFNGYEMHKKFNVPMCD